MKEPSTASPHDAVFKQFLCHTDTARDFLAIHLPPALRQHCNLRTLQLESGTFIEEDLRAYYSDVLYSLRTTRGDGYVYALIEHQSSPDKHMAFRLMRYAIAAMQRHLNQGHAHLPLVIPVLFYHGQTSPYPFTMNWLKGFEDPWLATTLYSGDFPLVDVTVMADDEIMTHRRIALLELVQKHIRQRDLAELLEKLVTLLHLDYTTDEQLTTLMNYMLQAGDTEEPDKFIRELAERMSNHKEVLMTIAQKLEEKAERRGEKKGEKKGERNASLKIALGMREIGMPMETIQRLTGLTEADLAPVQH